MLIEQKGRNDMDIKMTKKKIKTTYVVCGISLLFLFLNISPTISSSIDQHKSPLSSRTLSEGKNQADIPTWYLGDEWVYTVGPLSYSSPNGSFSGTIENFRQEVVQITDETYVIDITGDISGDLTIEGFSGELTGDITGSSSVRISDLAELSTELYSEGEITVSWIPFPYELNVITSSQPPLELYDYPIHVGEQWQLSCLTSITGLFSIQGIYSQPIDGSQWIDETVHCLGAEQISTPAGSFSCYEIGRTNTQAWYAPDVGNIAESIIEYTEGNASLHVVLTLQSFIRNPQPIDVSLDVIPTMVAPGTSVLVSGQAVSTNSGDPIQQGDILIQIPCTGDSWGTTTDSNGFFEKTIIAPAIVDDTAVERETGSGGVIVQCSSENLFGFRVQTLTAVQDTPPAVPMISGPTKGKIGVSYDYTFTSEDSEDDEIFYYVDWGDGTNSSWVGPFTSNVPVTLSHLFTKKGTYTIQGKARDAFYAESNWGTLQVNMPTFFSASFFFWKLASRFPFLSDILHALFG
jgi:hypothetical protein